MNTVRNYLLALLLGLGLVAVDVNVNESRAVLKAVAASTNLVSPTLSNPTITGTVTVTSTAFTGSGASYNTNASGNTGTYEPAGNILGLRASNTAIARGSNTPTAGDGFSGIGSLGITSSINLAPDVVMARVAANSMIFGTTAAASGAATSRAEGNKAITAFTEATPKTVATITIPNAAHSASIRVRITGSVGAGGAIGANEASATNEYIITVARTAGVAAVATISSAFGAAAANVAGATTITAVLTLEAVSGAVGATNTIGILGTLTTAGGSSDNHTAVVTWSLLNANATGITIA